jgi:hypothetical protein
MTKNTMFQTNSDSKFWISEFGIYFDPICFEFRASDFEFVSWLLGAINFLGVALCNISPVRI